MPPISLKDYIISHQIKKLKVFLIILEQLSKLEMASNNFWSTSGMMAPFYELLGTITNWLVEEGVKRDEAQKYVTSLFVALSEDAVINSKKTFEIFDKESKLKGLNEQGVKELEKQDS